MTTSAEVGKWLSAWIADATGIGLEKINPQDRFSDYGLDSPQIVRMISALSSALGRQISSVLVFRYPTITGLSAVIAGESATDSRLSARTAVTDRNVEPIAIVGMSCRFPRAATPAYFWRLLCDGVDAVGEIPADRWNTDSLYSPDRTAAGKAVAREGGFLDRIDNFDPLFFGISPREAREMDPQQRMMLELTWEALDDAGSAPESLRGSRTGVFIGAIWQDYNLRCAADLDAITQHSATGRAGNIIANRISYALGLRGPCMVVDTACSAALVAVHLACQSIRSGESEIAVAGGVNLMLAADTMVALSKFGGLSPDARSRAFDARANGFARGEGCAAIVLKPLSSAIVNGDDVYCVILGSAVNNNGESSSGLTAPSPLAQEAVIRDAWDVAGRLPQKAHYVEAHGTGTILGDPIEASALGSVFGAGRDTAQALIIGSVKTNIGHLEGAAGIAGLIKTALAIKHRAIPASIHFEEPNPEIDFEGLRLRVQTSLAPWPEEDELALAGVSSFGWGGTNAHVVLEEAWRHPAKLGLLAGETAVTLRAATGETGGAYRAAVVSRSAKGLSKQLCRRVTDKARRIAFVCAPQGSAWWGMGRELLATEPAFRAEIERLDRALRQLSPVSIIEELAAPQGRSRLDDVTVVQPLLFAVQAALTALLRSFGIEPQIVVGHSLGELVAAYVTGSLSLEDAVTVIHHHSRLYGRTSGKAGMALVGMTEARLREVLTAYGGRVTLAARNSPVAMAVSGEPDAIEDLLREMTAQDIPCSRINVNIGGHCFVLDPLLDEYHDSLQGMRPRTSAIPMMSTVTASRIAGESLDADHWVRNMREPVRFEQSINALLREGYETFIEIGPTPALTHSIQQSIALGGRPAFAVCAMRRGDERAALLEAVGSLYVRGVDVSATLPVSQRAEMLALSAKSPEALRHRARDIAALIDGRPDLPLSGLCYEAGVRRSHHEYRLAIVADSPRAIAQEAREFAASDSNAALRSAQRPGVVFVMAGQGSQWAGMGCELMRHEPVFRRAIERCDAAISRYTGWSLTEELARSERDSRLTRTEFAQPALFAIEIALTELWASWGVTPAAVIGHSVGEVAAACVSGVLSFEYAVRLACIRGAAMSGSMGQGRMAVAGMSEQDASHFLRSFGSGIEIAAVNSPRSVVLAGEPARLAHAIAALEACGVATRQLDVLYAFHSSQMAPCAASIEDDLKDLSPAAGSIPFFSTVDDTVDPERPMLDGAYWKRNIVQSVRFASAVNRALERGFELFVEVGPHPALARPLLETFDRNAFTGASMRRGHDQRQTMLESAGALYSRGVNLQFRGFCQASGTRVELPPYPWQYMSFPLEKPRTTVHHASQTPDSEPESLLYSLHWEAAATPPNLNGARGPWLIVSRGDAPGGELETYLSAAGHICSTVVNIDDIAAHAAHRCVVLPGAADLWSVVALVQRFARRSPPPRLCIVTRNCYSDRNDPGQSGLWGLAQAIRYEHPELRLRMIDLALDSTANETRALVNELLADDAEDSVLLRTDGRFVARLAALPPRLGADERTARVAIEQGGRLRRGERVLIQSAESGVGRSAIELARAAGAEVFATTGCDQDFAREVLQRTDGCGVDLIVNTLPADRVAPAVAALRAYGRFCDVGQAIGHAAPVSLELFRNGSTYTAIDPDWEIQREATYLITGGLGGLGLATAEWLARSGAQRLLLLSRTKPSATAELRLSDMRRAGAHIAVVSADVSDRSQVAQALGAIDDRWPLRGVIHAAGALDDGVLLQLNPERMSTPMRAKTEGAWNLHYLTSGCRLDFFVLYSSAVATVGAPGQGNYAAANACLDSLARSRRAAGLAAVSIAWGPWKETGMAGSRADNAERLASRGLQGLGREEALNALGVILRAGENAPANIAVMRFHAQQWSEQHRINQSRFAGMLTTQRPDSSGATERRARLQTQEPPVRREALELYLRDEAARILRVTPSQIAMKHSLHRLGLDSLMSLELRRRIEYGLGVSLPATTMWDYPTIAALAPFLLDRMGMPPVSADPLPEGSDTQLSSLLEALQQFAEEPAPSARAESV